MMILTSVSSWPKRNLLSSFQVRNDHRVPKFETFFFFVAFSEGRIIDHNSRSDKLWCIKKNLRLTCFFKFPSIFPTTNRQDPPFAFSGLAVGLKNWLRITFAADPSSLEEGLERIKSFYYRHTNRQHGN